MWWGIVACVWYVAWMAWATMLAPPGAQWPAVVLLHGSFAIGYIIAGPPSPPASRGRGS